MRSEACSLTSPKRNRPFPGAAGDVITVQAAQNSISSVGEQRSREKLLHSGLTLTQQSCPPVGRKGKLLQLTRASVGGLLATTN